MEAAIGRHAMRITIDQMMGGEGGMTLKKRCFQGLALAPIGFSFV
jgi:hypothetical protein